MSNQKEMISLIKQIAGQANVLTIPRVFIQITGDIKAALFLSQCIYWSDKSKREDGFFYKTMDEWTEETGLSRHEIDRIREQLDEYIQTKLVRANAAPTLHYRVNMDAITEAICRKAANGFAGNRQNDLPESGNSDLPESDKSLTEITHQTTTKTTVKRGAEKTPRPPLPDSKHPAILAFKGITGKFPRKETYEIIMRILGDTPDGPRLKKCWDTLNQRGINPQNVECLLEWYANGVPERGPNGNGHKPARPSGRIEYVPGKSTSGWGEYFK